MWPWYLISAWEVLPMQWHQVVNSAYCMDKTAVWQQI